VATYFKSRPNKEALTKVKWYKLDLRSFEDVDNFINTLEYVDSVIFCAGVSIPEKIGSIQKESTSEMFAVNITSVIQISNKLISQLENRNFFRFIFLSSVIATSGGIGLGVYASTKAAIEGFALSLNRELLKFKKMNSNLNVSSAVIRLGYTDTPMTSSINPKIKALIEERMTLNRFLNPKEVATLVLYLLNPKSDGFTGSILDLNGGINL